jgi:anti-sigma-K factor RskA
VLAWEQRWFALELRAPRVRPPAAVWRHIEARIAPRRATRRRFAWSAAAAFAGAAALWLGLSLLPPPTPAPMMLARLDDARGQPALLVTWRRGEQVLNVRVLAHPEMPAGTSWQAWLLAADRRAPVALGEIGVEPEQRLRLAPATAALLDGAHTIGVSVEPKGAVGGPTLPFLFVGPAHRIDG